MYYNKTSRACTRNAFITSVTLHILALLLFVINLKVYDSTYIQPDSLVSEESVELYLQKIPAPRLLSQSGSQASARKLSASVPSPQRIDSLREIIQEPHPLERITQPRKQQSVPIGTEVKIVSSSKSTLLDKGNDLSAPINSEPEGVNLKGGVESTIARGAEQKSGNGTQRNQDGDSTGELDLLDIDAQIGAAMNGIAGQVVAENKTGMVDIVFLLDTSGSMDNNIHAVGNHLSDMAEIFVKNRLDFTLGVVKFKYLKALVFPQTTDISKYQRLLKNVKCGGDERAYDAIVKALSYVKFRPNAERRFILVTDEKMKGSYSTLEVLRRCQRAQIRLDIISTDDIMHKYLARQTGGRWYLIP